MTNKILVKRGVLANLVTLAGIGGLTQGEIYLVTDKQRLAVGLTTTTFGIGTDDSVLLDRANHTGTQSADSIVDGTTNKAYTATEKTKLSGIATGATNYSHPSNHPPSIITQDASNRFVTDAQITTWNGKQAALGFTPVDAATVGAANGVAPLGATSKVNITFLPFNGTTKQVMFNNGTSIDGATNVSIDNGELLLAANNSPVLPSAFGAVKLYCRSLAGRDFLETINASNTSHSLQPSLWRQRVGTWTPQGNSTTLPGVTGFAAPTTLGTITARSVSTTNLFSRTKRMGYVSIATAANFAGHYSTIVQNTTGDGAGLGGFFYSCLFGFSDAAAVAGARAFVGLSSNNATPTNVEPNTLTNSIGIAQLSTDSTQLFIVSGGSAAQTAIALGTNFPPMAGVGITNGIAYELTLFSPSNLNGVIKYRVERLGTNFFVEGTLTPATVGTQTPSSATLLTHRAWRCNNAQALSVGIDIVNIYTETDY
jgi:hypothetical protein